ncbi:MAG: DUF4390 domain-containing protein [Gammaproteobacteria bacterium]|nr:DUF4390 domain-containing protein [Gammaproteobacteria bacterium]
MNFKKYLSELFISARLVICFSLALFVFTSAHAGEFFVVSAQMNKVNDTYHLSAQLGYELSTEVNEALQNGIPVTLKLEAVIVYKRDFLWAKKVTKMKQRFRLRYHALSEQYLVKNLNSGEQAYYKVLDDALYNLEHVVDLPIFDAKLLDPGKNYVARIRTSVDITELPVPLRYFAYFSSGWNLTSGWFSWDFLTQGIGV